jgi:hypothetical protein
VPGACSFYLEKIFKIWEVFGAGALQKEHCWSNVKKPKKVRCLRLARVPEVTTRDAQRPPALRRRVYEAQVKRFTTICRDGYLPRCSRRRRSGVARLARRRRRQPGERASHAPPRRTRLRVRAVTGTGDDEAMRGRRGRPTAVARTGSQRRHRRNPARWRWETSLS